MKFYVTMGTSFRYSRCWKMLNGAWPFDPTQTSQAPIPWDTLAIENVHKYCGDRADAATITDDILRRMGSDSVKYAEHAETIVDARFVMTCWNQDKYVVYLPAELATLKVMSTRIRNGAEGNARLLTDQDEVTFVASEATNTISGEHESTVREAHLCMYALLKCMPVLQNKVTVLELPSWAPSNALAFHETSNKFWTHVRTKCANGDCGIVLTGGYKGMAIDVARRTHGRAQPPSLYYLHESSRNEIIEWDVEGKVSVHL